MFPIIRGLCCLLLLIAVPAWALDPVPIKIEADSLDIDEKHGLSVYKGNVRMSQGDLKLTANQVIIYKTKKSLQRIVAKGNPVQINVAARGSRQAMRAQALQMEYTPLSNRVVMEKDARLWQGKNEFSSHYIEYQMDKNLISAKGDKGNSGRVHVTIHPEDKGQDGTKP